QDVGVVQVALDSREALGGTHEEPATALVIEERGEDRLRVETRQAAPDDLPAARDQGRELAVADQPQVFQAHGRALYPMRPRLNKLQIQLVHALIRCVSGVVRCLSAANSGLDRAGWARASH